MRFVFIVITLALLVSCHWGDTPQNVKEVEMFHTNGDLLGTTTLTEHSEGVKIKLKLKGMSPGWHGIHIHEEGKCDPPNFKSAKNHLNPEDKEHGLMNPKGSHLGDLPNVKADNSGEISEELIAKGVTLLEGRSSLTRDGGTSIIIDAEADDGMSQISGDSGERIVCGVIEGEDT